MKLICGLQLWFSIVETEILHNSTDLSSEFDPEIVSYTCVFLCMLKTKSKQKMQLHHIEHNGPFNQSPLVHLMTYVKKILATKN